MKLILARHGQSTANAVGAFTGWSDVELTDRGRTEAGAAGERLRSANLIPDRIFCSPLRRCTESAAIIAATVGARIEPVQLSGLRERDYGALTGKSKLEAADCFGAEQVRLWRRSYAAAPPDGESLRDTAARVLSAYVVDILPAVLGGAATLVVAHGNSLRALGMTLNELSPAEVEDFEIATGEMLSYTLDRTARVIERAKIS